MTTPAPLELRSRYTDGVLVVDASGEIDMATSAQLSAAIEAATDSTSRVVVNLCEVGFLDSSALNALVHSRRELTRRGIDLRVVSPRDRIVRRVFEITRLTEELSVVDSLDDALA